MSAVSLALLATLSFASSNIFLARGSQTAVTTTAVRLSVYIGVPFFVLVATLWGKFESTPPASAFLYFASAGALHFGLGRTLMWGAVRLLGASRAMLFIALSPVISLVGAVVIFDEVFTTLAVLGAALAISGPVIAGRFRDATSVALGSGPDWRGGATRAVFGALCWGASPLLVKGGLDRDVPAQVGIIISYATAAIILASLAAVTTTAVPIRRLPRTALMWFVMSSMCTNTAQLLMYMAYDAGDVTTVVVIVQLTPLIVTGLTFLVNRDVERVTWGVVAGGALAVVGSMLVVGAR